MQLRALHKVEIGFISRVHVGAVHDFVLSEIRGAAKFFRIDDSVFADNVVFVGQASVKATFQHDVVPIIDHGIRNYFQPVGIGIRLYFILRLNKLAVSLDGKLDARGGQDFLVVHDPRDVAVDPHGIKIPVGGAGGFQLLRIVQIRPFFVTFRVFVGALQIIGHIDEIILFHIFRNRRPRLINNVGAAGGGKVAENGVAVTVHGIAVDFDFVGIVCVAPFFCEKLQLIVRIGIGGRGRHADGTVVISRHAAAVHHDLDFIPRSRFSAARKRARCQERSCQENSETLFHNCFLRIIFYLYKLLFQDRNGQSRTCPSIRRRELPRWTNPLSLRSRTRP